MLTEDVVMTPLETVPENSAMNISDYSDGIKDKCDLHSESKLGTTPSKNTVIFPKPLVNDNHLHLQSTANVRIEEGCEDEENAEDETVTTPPTLRKTSILDTLRPRSKSDAYASYKQRKSSFLTQLKMKKNKNVSFLTYLLLEYLTF